MRATASSLAAGLLAVALVWALSLGRTWDAVEAKVFDLFTTLSAPHASTLPLVILAIDEPSFQALQQQWPFPRSLHGRLLERLHADGAAAVGFDVVFAEPSSAAEDASFARAIAAAGPVVLASTQEMIESGNAALWTQVQPLPQLLAAGAVAGDISVRPDDDYVVRRQANGADSFATQLARHAPLPAVPPRETQLIEYLGPRGTIDTRSYYQALEPGLLPPGFFRGKIVLIGRSSRSAVELQTSRADTFNSPFAVAERGDRLFPGVEIQATLLANRLSGGGLNEAPNGWVLALVAALAALLVIATSSTRLGAHPGVAAALAAGSAIGVVGLSYGLFTLQKIWLPPLFPVAAVVALYGTTALLAYLAVRRRALRVRGMFSQYVPPEVVSRLVEEPALMRLGGEAREVTLMFTDLANFTGMSEQLTAEQTVEVLTAYFNAMTPVIHRWHGTVDKFIGDAVMAFWGAPLDDAAHAEHALRAAIEMQAAMQPLVAGLRARGLPPIGMRIGLHTGRAVIGNVGSDTRFSYTAIGDAVNLAARLEGANKAFGTGILLSDSTAAQLPESLPLRPLDDVIVKGKTAPVRVFTPCGDATLCAR
ncbi:MAG: adenylate/guanylate cyclase domain-containing protein, partial [Comamonadaceae bacterium]